MGNILHFPPTIHKPLRDNYETASVTSIDTRGEILKLQAMEVARINTIVEHAGRDIFHDNFSVLSWLRANRKFPSEWNDSLDQYMIGID